MVSTNHSLKKSRFTDFEHEINHAFFVSVSFQILSKKTFEIITSWGRVKPLLVNTCYLNAFRGHPDRFLLQVDLCIVDIWATKYAHLNKMKEKKSTLWIFEGNGSSRYVTVYRHPQIIHHAFRTQEYRKPNILWCQYWFYVQEKITSICHYAIVLYRLKHRPNSLK